MMDSSPALYLLLLTLPLALSLLHHHSSHRQQQQQPFHYLDEDYEDDMIEDNNTYDPAPADVHPADAKQQRWAAAAFSIIEEMDCSKAFFTTEKVHLTG